MGKKDGNIKSRTSEVDVCIGLNMRAMRLFSANSQASIAEILGVSTQQIQKYENGSNRLPVRGLYRLKAFFNVPYEYFFSGVDGQPVMGMEFLHADKISIDIFNAVKNLEDHKLKTQIKKMIETMVA